MPPLFTGGMIMAARDDYIPSNDADFDNWFKNLCQYVNQQCTGASPRWTHIPAAARTELNDQYAAWYTAYAKTKVPCTKEDRDEKNRVLAVSKKKIRAFVNACLRYHPDVTNDDKERMGLHLNKPRRPVIPPPATVPELSPTAGPPRQVIIPYRDKGAEHRGKPADVHGIEIRWAFMDHPPTAIEKELFNSAFDTRSPHTLVFEESDRGKRIYLAGRWELEREGVKGNFGDIVSTIVP
jgi:hypothetical protein